MTLAVEIVMRRCVLEPRNRYKKSKLEQLPLKFNFFFRDINFSVNFSKVSNNLGIKSDFSQSAIQFVSGIHEPSGPGTDRSDLIRDFLNFIGPGKLCILQITG